MKRTLCKLIKKIIPVKFDNRPVEVNNILHFLRKVRKEGKVADKALSNDEIKKLSGFLNGF